MCRGIQSFAEAGADGVEVNVGHGCDQRPFVAEQLAFVAAFPEPPLAAVFAIGAACDRLSEAAHEPGQVAETSTDDVESAWIGEQTLTLELDSRGFRVGGGTAEASAPLPRHRSR